MSTQMPSASLLDQLSKEEREQVIAEVEHLATLQGKSVTPSEEWQSPRKKGFLIELPSGNICRVRRTMAMLDMIQQGTLPNPLRGIVEAAIGRGEMSLAPDEMSSEARIQALDLIDAVVVSSVVEPRVLRVPDGVNPEAFMAPPGAITLMDLTNEDKMFINSVAMGGTTNLEQFRIGQGQLVEPLQPRQIDAVPTKQPARPKRSGSGSKRKR